MRHLFKLFVFTVSTLPQARPQPPQKQRPLLAQVWTRAISAGVDCPTLQSTIVLASMVILIRNKIAQSSGENTRRLLRENEPKRPRSVGFTRRLVGSPRKAKCIFVAVVSTVLLRIIHQLCIKILP